MVPPLPPGAAQELRELEVSDERDAGAEEVAPGEEPEAEGAEPEAGESAPTGETAPPASPPGPPAAAQPAGPPTVVESWDKVLPATDAQQPPSANTNPTGNLRLTKARHDIDWLTFFRHVLFGPTAWVRERDSQNNPIETAAVPMRVTINGTAYGTIAMRVDHAFHRESGQANHATVLPWGELLPILTATDYTDYTVTLARLSDGSYSLDISP